MIALVTGGAASGKSEIAERLAVKLSGEKRLYIASMQPLDAESERRIARHRKNRAGRGFDTLECYGRVRGIPPGYGVALLECVSNVLANCTFGRERCGPEQIVGDLLTAGRTLPHLVVVTNEVFSDGEEYPPETARYLCDLGEINRTLGAACDLVLEAVCGIPVTRKGEAPCL